MGETFQGVCNSRYVVTTKASITRVTDFQGVRGVEVFEEAFGVFEVFEVLECPKTSSESEARLASEDLTVYINGLETEHNSTAAGAGSNLGSIRSATSPTYHLFLRFVNHRKKTNIIPKTSLSPISHRTIFVCIIHLIIMFTNNSSNHRYCHFSFLFP